MARALRIQFEGAWYHVMNRGVNRGQLFFHDDHRYMFLDLLREIKIIYGVEIHAFCLMSNHYHLILHTPRGNISQSIKYLNAKFAAYVNKNIKRDGPLFKGRFKAILVGEDDYLIRLSKYIHLNPLEAKMTCTPSSYKWSSYIYYVGIVKSPDWLTTNEIINRFGSDNFIKRYKEFVEMTSDEDLVNFFDNYSSQPILGHDNFRHTIDDYVKKHSLSAEIVGANQILVPPSMISIINAVALHFKILSLEIYQPCIAKKNIPRRIAIYICRQLGGYGLSEISQVMGNVSYKTISSTIQRIKANASQMKIADEIIESLRRESITVEMLQNIETKK